MFVKKSCISSVHQTDHIFVAGLSSGFVPQYVWVITFSMRKLPQVIIIYLITSHCPHSFFCFVEIRFRISAERIKMTLMKLKLLELGEFQKCSELDNIVFDSSVFGDDDPSSQNHPNQVFDRYELLYQHRVSSHLKLPSDSLIRKMQREVIDSFNKEALACKRCDSCGSFSPALRKDGSSKIFEKPLQKRLRKSMSGMKLSLKVILIYLNALLIKLL